jgi:hypothetical protein
LSWGGFVSGKVESEFSDAMELNIMAVSPLKPSDLKKILLALTLKNTAFCSHVLLNGECFITQHSPINLIVEAQCFLSEVRTELLYMSVP